MIHEKSKEPTSTTEIAGNWSTLFETGLDGTGSILKNRKQWTITVSKITRIQSNTVEQSPDVATLTRNKIGL